MKKLLAIVGALVGILQGAGAGESCSSAECAGWTGDIYGSVLILKPASSLLSYAAEAYPLPAPSPSWNIYRLNPSHHVGFDIGAHVGPAAMPDFLGVNWQHIRGGDTACVAVHNTDNMIGPFFEIGPDALPYKKVVGDASFQFDLLNIRFGQRVNLADRCTTYFFVGAGFTHLGQKTITTFSNEDATVVRQIQSPSFFTGGGPQVGVEFSYRFGRGFALVGNADATLFVGSACNHTIYFAQSPALEEVDVVPPNKQHTFVQKSDTLVPGFTQKVGLLFSHEFFHCCSCVVEVGYQAQIYCNTLHSVGIGSEVITPPVTPDTIGVYARTFDEQWGNFFLMGPYVTLGLSF